MSPLLLRDGVVDGVTRLPRRPDGGVFLPGSSVKGAIRSLHETLAGGCLRVFDADFEPSYRDSTKGVGDVRMAVVWQVRDDGRPDLALCEPGDPLEDRLRQDDLERWHSEKPLHSGERFDRDNGVFTRSEQGDWVMLLSDANARDTKYAYRARVCRLPEQLELAEVSAPVWREFQTAVAGSRDQDKAAQSRHGDDPFTDVVFEHKPDRGPSRKITLGRRHLASDRLRIGQPVWARMDGKRVAAVRLGVIWRHGGSGASGDRIDADGLSCDDEELCPSCTVFGSVDPNGDTEEEGRRAARQVSYRGHVRFGDARPTDPVVPRRIDLPPQGRPRPGAGQFYLANGSDARGNGAKPLPLREWRAGESRRLRGRKFYWHTPTPDGEPPRRAKVGPGQDNEAMNSTAELVPTGTTFTATITFTDLDRAGLGGLLAALHPRDLLGSADLVQHVGGGRPLGLGSCRITVDLDASRVWSSAARYGGAGAPVDLTTMADFLDAFTEAAPMAVRQVWPLVAKALNPNTVSGEHVTYPPGAPWAAVDSEKFHEGFPFWKQTSGLELAADKGVRSGYPLTPLPDLADEDQTLPIVTSATAKPLRGAPEPRGRAGRR